ncbi:MAG TPA: hypothetical protein ENJ90_07810 [Devosia sp.]|nr:hypothetical protein [Devosia sp.]
MFAVFRFVVFVVCSMVVLTPAPAQRLVSKLSATEVSINSTFAGESLTLFGNVEAPIGENGRSVTGPFDIIIVIQGPATRRVVRQKSPQLGIWLNSDEVIFSAVPAYYHVLTTGPLNKIADEEMLREQGIGLVYQAVVPQNEGQSEAEIARYQNFADQLVRLMGEAKMFGLSERRVSFLSRTFYNANLTLPANVPNGTYLAKTYLLADGELLDQKAERFVVRTTGAERFIGNAARDLPLAYGLASVLIALFTGWLGAVAFRR